MEPDDEIVFGRALDETRQCAERIDSLRGSALAMDLAEFELHGTTLQWLAKWYPDEPRVRRAVLEWNLEDLRLEAIRQE